MADAHHTAAGQPPMPLLQLLLQAIGATTTDPDSSASKAMSIRMRTRVVDACLDLLRYVARTPCLPCAAHTLALLAYTPCD
jgi:hypothetical protein